MKILASTLVALSVIAGTVAPWQCSRWPKKCGGELSPDADIAARLSNLYALNIQVDVAVAQVVRLATWDDTHRTRLTPHKPEFTGVLNGMALRLPSASQLPWCEHRSHHQQSWVDGKALHRR